MEKNRCKGVEPGTFGSTRPHLTTTVTKEADFLIHNLVEKSLTRCLLDRNFRRRDDQAALTELLTV